MLLEAISRPKSKKFGGGATNGDGILSNFPVVGSYFRGLPLERCRLLRNSQSSTVQNEPKSSSYLTKHLCKDKFVRIAFFKKKEVGK